MAERQVGEIRISRRVLRIGHQTYPLANISRVQTARVVWAGRKSTWYPLRRIAGLLVLAGVSLGATNVVLPQLDLGSSADLEQTARQAATVVSILAAAWIGWSLLVLLYRLLLRRTRYALLVETSGTQYTALSGTDLREVHRIEGVIIAAIEDPPANEISVQVHGDLVMGDQTKQTGAGSQLTVNR